MIDHTIEILTANYSDKKKKDKNSCYMDENWIQKLMNRCSCDVTYIFSFPPSSHELDRCGGVRSQLKKT